MTTIKINYDDLSDAVTKALNKANEYEEKVITAASIFSEVSLELDGQSYDALLSKMDNKLESQKRIVAECQILSEEVQKYIQEMSDAEANTSFPG